MIDGFIDGLAAWRRAWSPRLDDLIDRYFVDGLVNCVAGWTYGIGAVAARRCRPAACGST